MHAVRRNDPEAVIRIEARSTEQPLEPGPWRIGYGNAQTQEGLPGLIKDAEFC